jgi:hypothetical protein
MPNTTDDTQETCWDKQETEQKPNGDLLMRCS